MLCFSSGNVFYIGGPEPLWGGCILPRIMSSQCSGIPWGFPSDLTSHPSSNSNSEKRRDLSFGCLLPFAFSGVRLSSDLLWSFPRLAQSPGLLNHWMEETAHHKSDLFLDDHYPGQNKDWLRSCLFFFLSPCHVVHCSAFEACYTGFSEASVVRQSAVWETRW